MAYEVVMDICDSDPGNRVEYKTVKAFDSREEAEAFADEANAHPPCVYGGLPYFAIYWIREVKAESADKKEA